MIPAAVVIDGNQTWACVQSGIQTLATATQYVYNGFNQQTSVETDGKTVDYTYYPNGLRKSKAEDGNTVTFVLDGGNVVAEQTLFMGQSGVINYVYGVNLISRVSSTDRSFYLHNGHGDVVKLTGTTGAVTRSYDYDAFGNQKNADALDVNPFRYCSEYWDAETKTYYLRARYYDPGTGRFQAEDTNRGQSNNPLSLNLYTYCYNNAVMYSDPSGNVPVLPLLLLLAGVLTLSGCSPEYFTFNSSPSYTPSKWNTSEYQTYTNCYAYAFNMLVNPLTGKSFTINSMQPGMLSGIIKYPCIMESDKNNVSLYLSGTTKGNAYLVELVTADMATIGLDFIPYEDGMTGGYKVALVVNPDKDYHWYRQDADGTWSHKQGGAPISQDIGYYMDKNGNLKYNSAKITDPKKDAATIGYTSFVGYYYVRPST